MLPFRRFYSVAASQKTSAPSIVSKIRSQLLSTRDPKTHIKECNFIFNALIKDGNYEKFKIYEHIPDFNQLFIQKMNLMISYKNEDNGNTICLQMLEYFLQHSESFNGTSFFDYFDVLGTLRTLIRVESNKNTTLNEETSKYLLLLMESYLIVNPNIESYSLGDFNDLFRLLKRCHKNTQSYELANKLIIPIIENTTFGGINFYREALLDLLVYQKRYYYLEKLFQNLYNSDEAINDYTHKQIFRVVSLLQDKKALESIIQIKSPSITLNNANLAHYFLSNGEDLKQQLTAIEKDLSNTLDYVNVMKFQKVILKHLSDNFDSYEMDKLLELVYALKLRDYVDIDVDSFVTREEAFNYYQWRTALGILLAKINLKKTGDVTKIYCLVCEFLDSTNMIGLITPNNYKEICNMLIAHFEKDTENGMNEIQFLKSIMTKFENRENEPTLSEE